MQEVSIHCSCLKEDLIKIVKVEDLHYLAGMMVIDECKSVEEDGEGVSIATFWRQFFSSTTISLSATNKSPSNTPHYQKSEWEAIGGILVYGFKRAEYIPVPLSKALVHFWGRM